MLKVTKSNLIFCSDDDGDAGVGGHVGVEHRGQDLSRDWKLWPAW